MPHHGGRMDKVKACGGQAHGQEHGRRVVGEL